MVGHRWGWKMVDGGHGGGGGGGWWVGDEDGDGRRMSYSYKNKISSSMTHYYHPCQWPAACYHHPPSSSHYVPTIQHSSFILCLVQFSTHHLPFAIHHHYSTTFHSSPTIYNPLPPFIHHHHSSIMYYLPPSPSTTLYPSCNIHQLPSVICPSSTSLHP